MTQGKYIKVSSSVVAMQSLFCHLASAPVAAIICNLLVTVLAIATGSAAQAEEQPDLLKLLKRSEISVGYCSKSVGDENCQQLAAALADGKSIHRLAPVTTISSRNDAGFKSIGDDCPSTENGIAGQPLEHFDLEIERQHARPLGRFTLFDPSPIYQDWHGYRLVLIQGYQWVYAEEPKGLLSWKDFWAVPDGDACKGREITPFYFGDPRANSPYARLESLIEWRGSIFLLTYQQELPTFSEMALDVIKLSQSPERHRLSVPITMSVTRKLQ